MYAVIFRAKARAADADYERIATELRDTALRDFGCIDFVSMGSGDDELTVSYWPDEESILRWKAHLEHRAAQEMARQRWYASYRVEIAKVERKYAWSEG